MSDKNTNTGHRNSGHRNSGNINSGDRNSGNMNSGHRNSGNINSGNMNSGNMNSGDRNSGNMNSGNMNSGDWNSGHRNSGDRNSGNMNSGDMNSGDWNSGDRNSGNLNTNEPDIKRVFNAWIKVEEYRKIQFPDLFYFYLTKWISHDTATDQEKIDHKESIETCGGYLKTLDYKEAWKASWDKATREDKAKLYAIPGYKRELFLEISGIDAGDGPIDEETEKLIKDLESKGYKVVKHE